uniref:Uncharacterized protein n=1 Tax=Rhizophora mucronata TaxID=61149 RepID=A0A2P2NEG0_RHIMU
MSAMVQILDPFLVYLSRKCGCNRISWFSNSPQYFEGT